MVHQTTEDVREWSCICGNELGVIRKKNDHRTTVLDQYGSPMPKGRLSKIRKMNIPPNFVSLNVIRADIKCLNCGRIRPWNSSEFLIEERMKELGLEELYLQAKGKTSNGGD